MCSNSFALCVEMALKRNKTPASPIIFKFLILLVCSVAYLDAFVNFAAVPIVKSSRQAKCSGQRRTTTPINIRCSAGEESGYSASDAGDLRKNPGLYQALGGASSVLSSTNLPATKPEILAPAGGWPQLRAAVQNGADAVYFGLTAFNARARASNFDADEELPEVMAYLHTHGVLGYAVLNVLVFDTELTALEAMVRKIAAAGVDAVIVQDLVHPPPPPSSLAHNHSWAHGGALRGHRAAASGNPGRRRGAFTLVVGGGVASGGRAALAADAAGG